MEVFLTFLIITYRRPDKVARLLNLFLDKRWEELSHLKFEIVVADDHSEDDTWTVIKPVIDLLVERGWSVRYIYRQNNLRGDRNLYYGYTRDSLGKFVWFLCDDDLVDVGLAIPYLETVNKTNPLVSICGFLQGVKTKFGNQLGTEIRLVTNFSEAVGFLVQFPKTTAYIMRRCPEINLDETFERWDRTLFSWIGVSIVLLAEQKNKGVLIYPPVVAYADDDFGLLQYSYRVFGKLQFVVRDSIQLSGMSIEKIEPYLVDMQPDDEVLQCLYGLCAHYNWRSYIKYKQEILESELTFLKKNWFLVFLSGKRVVSFCKLFIYFMGSYAFNS